MDSNVQMEEDNTRQDEVQKDWAAVASGPSLAAEGMSLKFVAPVLREGKKVAQLPMDELAVGADKWAAAMVFYVVGATPTITAVKKYIATNWNSVSMPRIFLHDDGYFLIHFKSMDDRNEILYSGPHMYFGKPIITKPWTHNFDFNEEVLKVIPLWVKLPNLPLKGA